ncbi:MAG TPA: hypothetical protein VGB54_05450 [Allosphingosinicella sp.]|jgi:hypothetical protein
MRGFLSGLIVALLFAAGAAPAAAQQAWRHQQSGIAIDRLPAGLRLGEVRDIARDGTDVAVTLGSAEDAVTLFIYRAAYPNAALWFERSRLAMNTSFGAGAIAVDARPFTLGPATQPNGLREELDMPPGRRALSAAIALAQHGEWLIKVRISSLRDRAPRLRQRMDELLASLSFRGGSARSLPLRVPSTCSDQPAFAGRAVSAQDPARLVSASAGAQAVARQVRGDGGLAAAPEQWCRAVSRFPADQVSLFRRLDGRGWAALLGDNGYAVTGQGHAGSSGAAVYGSRSTGTTIAALFDDVPAPDGVIEAALPFAVGRRPGLDNRVYGRVGGR